MKYLKQKNTGCTGTLKANMSQDRPLLPKTEIDRKQKGVIKVIKSKTVV